MTLIYGMVACSTCKAPDPPCIAELLSLCLKITSNHID